MTREIDCISRAEAIETVKKRLYETAMNNMEHGDIYADIADNRIDIWLSALPSAEPKTGKWVKIIDEETPNLTKWHYECDQCGAGRWEEGQRYCQNCGARMNREDGE